MRIQYCFDCDGRKRRTRDVVSDWASITVLQGNDLARYLVGTAGYVLLDHTDRFLKVMVNLDVVSETAFAALCYELADQSKQVRQPVFIASGDTTVYRFSGGWPAIEFIAAQMSERAPVTERRYDRRSTSLDGTSRDLFRHLESVCTGARVFDSGLVRDVLFENFGGRYVVVRPNGDNGRLTLTESGHGYPRFNEDLRRQDGKPFGEFSDAHYSTFVQQAYREAWEKQQVVLEDIEATLPSGSSALPSALASYERILIPVRVAEGPALLSATMMKT